MTANGTSFIETNKQKKKKKMKDGSVLIQKYFGTVYDYAGKADLNMGYWNPERKLGKAGHFFL